jgi:DNA-binding NarL/FixJ family response regulator
VTGTTVDGPLARAGRGAVFEGRARAAHLASDSAGTIELYEQAYRAYRRERELLPAARSARTIAWLRGWIYGEWAVANGWMARARGLLEQAGDDTREHAWVLLADAQAGDDLDEQRRQYRRVIELARRHHDGDLECEARSRLGVMLVLSGLVEEGMGELDESLAATCGGDVEDLSVVEGTFCGLFYACERVHDVVRAEQWLRMADDLVRRRRLTGIGGYCRAHYGGILTAAGRWAEAETTLTAAAQLFAPEHVRIRGNVLCRLADLQVRRGRLEEAAQLLQGLEQHEDAVRPLAALHLARGEPALAQEVLERVLEKGGLVDAVEGPLLALLADVHVASGATDDARQAVDRLGALARQQSGIYLKALAALARGRLCVATGSADARACLHEALTAFDEAGMPVEVAQVRLELARAHAISRSAVAVAEASAALETFRRAQATRSADEAAALLRSLGAAPGPPGRGHDVLTRREGEVLELLGHGLTNGAIGERLFISPKTVEHHVGRILAKLGLRSRAEAAAYAVRLPARLPGAPEHGPK